MPTDPKKVDATIKAIFRNDLAFVESAIREGLDVNAQDSHGRLPLMEALEVASHPAGGYELGPDEALPRGTPPENLRRMVHLLLDAGADIGLKNRDERPVLDGATAPDLFILIVERALGESGGDLKKAAKRLQAPHKRLVQLFEFAKGKLAQR